MRTAAARARRQAAPLRFGGKLGETRGFTISALLEACSNDVQGVRDAALLSLGYDAGLRVSEFTAVEIKDLRPQGDGTDLLLLPGPGCRQTPCAGLPSGGRKAGSMKACYSAGSALIGAASVLRKSPMPVGVKPMKTVRSCLSLYRRHHTPHAPGRDRIYRRIALAAARAGLVDLPAGELDAGIAALSSHSLRVGLTQDLFAAGEDAR